MTPNLLFSQFEQISPSQFKEVTLLDPIGCLVKFGAATLEGTRLLLWNEFDNYRKGMDCDIECELYCKVTKTSVKVHKPWKDFYSIFKYRSWSGDTNTRYENCIMQGIRYEIIVLDRPAMELRCYTTAEACNSGRGDCIKVYLTYGVK